MSRAYTEEEARELVLKKFAGIAKYWAQQDQYSVQYRCEGVVFSILAELDGCGIDFPGMALVLDPHPDDKEFHKNQGTNWFEPGMDISGGLHEQIHDYTEATL